MMALNTLVHEALMGSARRTPGRTALVCGRKVLSYGELLAQATSLAADMQFRGLRRSDRVVILLPNCPGSVVSIYATLIAGGAFSVVNAAVKAGKLDSILVNCEPAFVITDAAGLRTLAALPERLPRLGVYVTGDAPVDSISFDAACDCGRALAPISQVDVDLAAIIYTSGTTSTPKGVALSHQNMVSAARSIQGYLGLEYGDRILSLLPLSFDYGLYQLLLAMQVGASLVLRDGFGFPYDTIRAIAEQKISILPCVPTMMAILLRMEGSGANLENVRKITNTGAALPGAFVTRLKKMFPRASIYSMYGLTECKRVSWLDPGELEKRPDSVGQPMPNTEVYVVDDQGGWHQRDAVGELVVRGSNVMRGYFRNPEATARVLRDGLHPWEKVLYTGDLFRIDSEGYLYFIGRRDEVFKSRGERVSPREIEVVLYAFPGVAAARVVPVPDEVLGNAIVAEVSGSNGSLDAEALLRHCRTHLEERLVPREVRVVADLPLSAAGKVRQA
jgi:acyl-CoA synthetase (AMP-forming)/AMP-acid ligase II